MIDNRLVHIIDGSIKGMFSNANPSLIPDETVANLRNTDLLTYGNIRKAQGRTNTASGLSSGPNRGLAFFAPAGGTKQLVTFQNGSFYSWPNSGTWGAITNGTGLVDEVVDIVDGDNKLFFIKQSEVCRYYDGTNITLFTDTNTDPPKAKMGVYMLGWLLLGNDTTNPDGLYFGANNSPASGWNRTSNLLRFDKGQGGQMTGLKPWSNQDLLVFKEQRIYAATINNASPGSWTITPITSDIGCMSHHSIQQVGQDLFFLAQDGVRSLLQSAQDKKRGSALPLSYPIQDIVNQINWQYAADVACSTLWKGVYWLSVPVSPSTVNNKTFKYDPRREAWEVLDYGFNAFAQARFSSVPRLYSSYGAATGGVNLEESGFDDGTNAITYTIETKRINGPNKQPRPDIWKRGGEIEIEFESTGSYVVAVSAAVDGGAYTQIGTMTLTGALPQLPIALPFSLADQNISRKKFNFNVMGRFRDIQFKFSTSDLSAEARFIRAVVSMIPFNYVRDV